MQRNGLRKIVAKSAVITARLTEPPEPNQIVRRIRVASFARVLKSMRIPSPIKLRRNSADDFFAPTSIGHSVVSLPFTIPWRLSRSGNSGSVHESALTARAGHYRNAFQLFATVLPAKEHAGFEDTGIIIRVVQATAEHNSRSPRQQAKNIRTNATGCAEVRRLGHRREGSGATATDKVADYIDKIKFSLSLSYNDTHNDSHCPFV